MVDSTDRARHKRFVIRPATEELAVVVTPDEVFRVMKALGSCEFFVWVDGVEGARSPSIEEVLDHMFEDHKGK